MTLPERIRLHIATLQGHGWTLRAIAGHAGTSPTVVHRYAHGRVHRPHPILATAILRITPATIPTTTAPDRGEPFVPRIGTVRRIQALMAIGYSHTDLATHGINSRSLIHQPGHWVTRTTHDRVADAYRHLSRRPGPTPRSVREARLRGYPGPLAWDDIDHDPAPEREVA